MFILSIIAFLCASTMTSSLLFSVLFILLFFTMPNSKFNNNIYRLGFIITSLLFSVPILSIIFFNITYAEDFFEYYYSFYASIEFFLKQDIISQLFGLGKDTISIMNSQIMTPYRVMYT